MSFEGLREKEEFISKIKAWNALPLLTRITRLQGNMSTVVSSAVQDDMALTGGNDGTLRVWRLGKRDKGQAGLCLAEIRTPTR